MKSFGQHQPRNSLRNSAFPMLAWAKFVRSSNIPKPPLGYWTRIARGQKLDRTLLPPASSGMGELIEIESRAQKSSITRDVKYPAVYAEYGSIHTDNVVLERIESLSKLHPLLKESYKYFKDARPDAYSRLITGQTPCVGLTVSKASLERALKLMHTLFRFLEAQGFVIEVRKQYRMSTFVIVRDVKVEISLIEKVTRTLVSPSENSEKYSSADRKFVYRPNGLFSFRIINLYSGGIRKEWSDTEDVKLEDEIVAIAEGILNAAVAVRIQDLERGEQSRKLELQRIAEKEKQEQIQHEKARRDKLLQDSADWRASENLRAYIEVVRARREKKNSSDTELNEWIRWAKHVADELDPIRR